VPAAIPPFPNLPAPTTWAPGQQILTGNLRDDITNAARLLANKPLFTGQQTITGQALSTGISNLIKLDTEGVDAWGMHMIPSSTVSSRLPGWYLCDGYVEGTSIASTATISTGFRAVQDGGTVYDMLGGMGPGNGSNDQGYPVGNLIELDPINGDDVALISTVTAGCDVAKAQVKVEWVGMPTDSLSQNGTVVTNPQTASPWPFGSTTITNSGGIAAGATSMTVADPTGMVVGGVLGLDYFEGQAVSPLAEKVTITSVAGSTIGITATSYPHGGVYSAGYVAVPISAPFLNQQVRDMINFLCFPPMFEGHVTSGTQGIPSGSFPASNWTISFNGSVIDNFSGWGGSGSGAYTFPVSGVYYVYGQVAMTAAANYTLAAGLGVSGGTVNWGTTVRNTTSTPLALTATVRRHLRVTAGEYVELFASQNSGSQLDVSTGFMQCPRLVAVFRSF
jgi:hypothetical protein